MIVKKIIEPRYLVEMTAEQKEEITAAISEINRMFNRGQVPSELPLVALDDLRISLLNTG